MWTASKACHRPFHCNSNAACPAARSSVGSVTTMSTLIRLLYSRAGTYPPHQPMLYAEDFSPNTPQGACPACHGLGRVFEVNEHTMVPDPSLTIRERAVAAWPTAWQGQNLRDILVTLGHDVDKPWKNLPKKVRDWVLYTEERPTVPVYAGLTPAQTREALRRRAEPSYQGTFIGARKHVLHTFATSHSALMKRRAARFMVDSPCPVCHGKRLKKESLSVTFAGLDIGELFKLALDRLADVLGPPSTGVFDVPPPPGKGTQSLRAGRENRARRVAEGGSAHAGANDARRTPNLSEEKRVAARRICSDLVLRIAALQRLGLGYLSLDRSTPTLSSGELQRLRLATQIRSNLFGVVYVLDEPSAGLHPADTDALMTSLQQLKQAGNSIFVVEHDIGVMRRADWLVDVGPGAGEQGGRVLYSGPPEGLATAVESRTAHYLFGEAATAMRTPRVPSQWLQLRGVELNNLASVDARFPLGALTAVTGVSGSGKSSLVTQALVRLVLEHLGLETEETPAPGEFGTAVSANRWAGRIDSRVEGVKRLVVVDQRPIGRTPRSNLATYTGLFDQVRRLFAQTPAARKKKYDASRFSFNISKGRCETCEGEGFVSVELLFMPSVYAPCPTCHGARFNADTLKVRLRDRNIADVLGMTVDQAHAFFIGDAGVSRSLRLLADIGLGYLRLGQPATELSGGEAQRIKLATELQRTQHGNTLYVLDEPTSGLHAQDVDRLMDQLQRLVDAGNTVIVVEHDLRVIAVCDWVIDMGPGGGDAGGQVVASGPPLMLALDPRSRTGSYLHGEINHRSAPRTEWKQERG